MTTTKFILLSIVLFITATINAYRIGTGISDITGPVAQVMMMGYAELGQTGQGILQRLWARAFIIEDPQTNTRIVYVNTDTQSMGDIIKKRVVEELQKRYGDSLYTEKNIMISSTHSHSGMGGYLQYTMYEISVLGWIEETANPMVQGIMQSIINAHDNLEDGSLAFSQGELLNSNINRSPQAYLLNPIEERSLYKYDVDKIMTVLSFKNNRGDDLGLVSWFPVHGVSVNNTNRLINGDNKGYAAYLAEKLMNNQDDELPSHGKFVAAFSQSNEGDVSPNTMDSYCTGTDIPCDGTRDLKCPTGTTCNGRGPGWEISDIESNRIIGQNQALKALELHKSSSIQVEGKVDYVQRYWDITKSTVINKTTGEKSQLCSPAMGYAFAAGTTDGPALNGFYQNTTKGTFGWDIIKNIVKKPSANQKRCQAPKPILLDTGEMTSLHTWQPEILDIQLFRVGNVFIYAVPSEFTTMSGRRLRIAIKQALIKHQLGDQETVVIHSGPANGYASYCATFEEYQNQRYEGASTPYGPHTLQAYIQAFKELVFMMANPTNHGIKSEKLPDYTKKSFNLTPIYRSDQPHLFRSFGDVLRDVSSDYYRKNQSSPVIISALFVAGNPRNDPMLNKTFLKVEKKIGNDEWKVVRTDDDYDTRFMWRYRRQILGMSEATVEWHVGQDVEPGIYRLGYIGNSIAPFSKKLTPHFGYSSEFVISEH